MIADGTNIFFSHKNIKQLFNTANSKLSYPFEGFDANKLSLNKDKTKYTIFRKVQEKDKVPLKPSFFFINDKEIKRISSIKFL